MVDLELLLVVEAVIQDHRDALVEAVEVAVLLLYLIVLVVV